MIPCHAVLSHPCRHRAAAAEALVVFTSSLARSPAMGAWHGMESDGGRIDG